MAFRRRSMKSKPILNREELLKSIVRDRDLLSNYFQKLLAKDSQTPMQKGASTVTLNQKSGPVTQRDSYDLFFESACISIKSLPPKLAAEAKSRISQIITEYELRAISQQEAEEEREKLKNVKLERIIQEPTRQPSSEIVYEFQAYS